MAEKISVQIALAGGAEIEKQLADIGTAGQKAFTDISKAAEQAGGFKNLKPEEVTQKLKDLGVTGVDALQKIQTAVQSASRLETLVQGVQKVENAFASLGEAALRFGPILAEGVAAAGVAIAAGALATARALAKFATEASKTEEALTQLQKVSGVSFQNLSSLQQVFAGGGTSANKFAAELGKLSERIAEAGTQGKIRNASKDYSEWANDIDRVRQKFDQLANGADAIFSPLTTVETKVKALLDSLSRVPQVDQWARLANIFKNLGSDLERAQIGKSLGLSPETIATLTRGSEAIKQLQAESERLGLTLTSSNQQALQQMSQQWSQFSSLLSAFFQKIGALAAPAFGQMYATFTTVLQQIVSDFENLPLEQAAAKIGDRLGPSFTALGNVLLPILSAIGDAIGTALGVAFVKAVSASISEGIQNVKNKWGFGDGGGGALSPGGDGHAAGGLLGGRGSGTSDSNLAWVSRGEYITPASAVAQPGVLAFLEALRRSGGNLRNVLDGMGRFALGGMVRGPLGIPAFAGGGMHAVTINFPGLPEITGLRGSSGVVDELRKAAAMAQVRSGGRKPSRYS